MTRYLDAGGRSVVTARPLGSGGEGTVYALENQPGMVAKVYSRPLQPQDSEKIRRVVQVRSPRLDAISAWPRGTLHDPAHAGGVGGGDSVLGVVMPFVDFSQATELHNLYGPSSRRKHFPLADWRFLVHVARNVARAFAELHAEGHLMGDVSSRNILVTQQGTVRFVDADSFQIRAGEQVYPCPVGTAECTPPELQGQRFGTLVRTPNHDRFGLALMMFYLLFEGRHPYAGVHADGAVLSPAEAIARHKFAYSREVQSGVRPPPGTLTLEALPQGLRVLFERAFSPTMSGRPTAQEWETALAHLSETLVRCQRSPQHLHAEEVACPWCALFPATSGAATAKTHLPGSARLLDADAEMNRIWIGLRGVPIPPAPRTLTLQVLPVPMPVAVPVMPAVPPFVVLSGAQRLAARGRQLWGVGLLLAALLLKMEGLPVFLSLVVAFFGWLSIRAGHPKRRERDLRRRYEREQLGAVRTYQRQLQQMARTLEQEVVVLQRRLTQAQQMYQVSSALARYRAEFERLERRRREVSRIAKQERSRIEEGIRSYQQQSLERYLSLHAVQPGMLPGFGPALVASLHGGGVHTALEVELGRLRRVPGIGPKRTQELLWWRKTLEQFFSFDPAQVPAQVIEAARQVHQQELQEQLRVLEAEVPGLHHRVQAWIAAEQHAAEDVLSLMREIEQRQQAIVLLRSRSQ
ncbi:hypothetical protein MF271_18265 (plasmid) [Deinococcus sp. KNUC1210]|uniref:helix-hairpin-helix domain-containing protein n=1 Tax=Deinococcus sp. KNUC1210 TaxID=2917691 RepID=UPI001EF06A7D|nr:hypothetical protein [Deinococcus sp. KNUC1210]ULH17301.1 hypothetical protein MF271_18265 [Deinococcus sp. KNUC1210]